MYRGWFNYSIADKHYTKLPICSTLLYLYNRGAERAMEKCKFELRSVAILGDFLN